MYTFPSSYIQDVICRLLQAAGANEHEAAVVASHLAESNLVGHDSHGLIRLVQYVEFIEQGQLRPGAEIRTLVDLPSVAVLDGGFNFGQVVASQALKLCIARARQSGAYSIFCRNTNHVGRLGWYTRQAALEGMAAVMAVNGPGAAAVAPWGGLQRRYGTNPLSMAAPWDDEPIVLDMTTSTTAEGKLRVAAQQGESVPEGWILDPDGNPTTDPSEFYRGGSILPLGGSLGFKGYGLGVMVDIFCGVISGAGVARDDVPPGNNGVWLYVADVQQLTDPADYRAWLERLVSWLKSARRAPGVDQILLPGEIEARCRRQRLAQGIPVPEPAWRQVRQLADRLGCPLPDPPAP